MTTPLTKLIEENKERPIEEAPRDGTMVLLYDGDTRAWNKPIGGHWCKKVNGWASEWNCTPLSEQTHFRPLPDDRLARCFEILLNAALSAKEQNHIYEAAADIEIALQEITAIAEGKDNA